MLDILDFLQKEALIGGFSYDAAVVNSGQNHNSKGCKLKGGEYGYDQMNYLTTDRLAYANYDRRHHPSLWCCSWCNGAAMKLQP